MSPVGSSYSCLPRPIVFHLFKQNPMSYPSVLSSISSSKPNINPPSVHSMLKWSRKWCEWPRKLAIQDEAHRLVCQHGGHAKERVHTLAQAFTNVTKHTPTRNMRAGSLAIAVKGPKLVHQSAAQATQIRTDKGEDHHWRAECKEMDIGIISRNREKSTISRQHKRTRLGCCWWRHQKQNQKPHMSRWNHLPRW